MTLNVKRLNLLVFDSRNKSKEEPPVKLFINDGRENSTKRLELAKYLGVYFDKPLPWSQHIEVTNKKLHFIKELVF